MEIRKTMTITTVAKTHEAKNKVSKHFQPYKNKSNLFQFVSETLFFFVCFICLHSLCENSFHDAIERRKKIVAN